MHLHFVQSLDPLLGGGLGQSALSMHLAMRSKSDIRSHNNYISAANTLGKSDQEPSSQDNTPRPFSASCLLTTRSTDFNATWPNVIRGKRIIFEKFFFSPELKRIARSVVDRADFIHAHGFYTWLNWWLGSESRRLDAPLIYHVHGFFDPWILRRSRLKKQLVQWLFENRNMASVSWWRALSSKEADQIRAVLGSKVRIHVIPNGVDLTEIDLVKSTLIPISNGNSADICSNPQRLIDKEGLDSSYRPFSRHEPWINRRRPNRLLFLSRIHPKKGLDLLVSAWSRLNQEFPDWELLIVGPDEGNYKKIIEQMIWKSGCNETCRMYPAVFGIQKHMLIDTADLFVLPSYSEGFPMAVLEAAAHRIPVVQTSECNFPELTAAGGGWSCLPEKSSLEEALRKALSADNQERFERGLNGRQLVETRYSWDAIVSEVHECCHR
jgi:glycosyltransferase involved in cell wall biosynthesis